MGLRKFAKLNKLNKTLMILVDVGLVILGYYLAYIFKFNFAIPERNWVPFIRMMPIIGIMTIVFFDIYGLLSVRKRSFIDTMFSLGISLVMLALGTMALTFFFRGFAFPRSVFVIGYIVQLVLLSTWRYILIRLLRRAHGIKRVMVIGGKENITNIARKLVEKSKDWYSVKYLYYQDINSNINHYITEVDTIVITSDIDYQERLRIIQIAQNYNKEILVIPDLYEMFILKAKIDQIDDLMTFRIEKIELSLEQRIVKRVLDVVISMIGLIITAPIMLLTAAIIKTGSRGPILFKQERLTFKKRKFNLYKFRTMIQNAEEQTGPIIAEKKDPRVTKVGSWLRSTRIDELPQLINVLKGDMSIVGPRPERNFFVKEFEKASPSYNYRMNVKAGITGLAQILGKYASNYDEKLKFDLLYIRNYSLLLDIKIVMQTIKVLFLKEKSEGTDTERDFDYILKQLGLETYSEIGVTKIDEGITR